ncbi:MAG: hypothetical protein PHP42_09145, partial [Bacteroidota bacterium]|nr:hypothetical protein [Bacteroidota bacterium]
MKQSYLFLALLIGINLLFPQAQNSVILQKTYDELGITPRVTNSGVYAISSFDVAGNAVYLRDFDLPMMTVINGNVIQRRQADLPASLDLAVGFSRETALPMIQSAQQPQHDGSVNLKKVFFGTSPSLFVDNGGTMANASDEKIFTRVESRTALSLQFALTKVQKKFQLTFPSDLAYADMIGMDAKGNTFLLVERYRSEIPLSVRRDIYTLSSEGKILSILSVPMITYCTMIKEFQIDADGTL